MAKISEYGALNLILGLDFFKNHEADYKGSAVHGRIRLFINNTLTLDTANVHEVFAELADFVGNKEVVMCEYNGYRSSIVATTDADDKPTLEIKWSVKSGRHYEPKDALEEMNAGTRLYFLDPQAVQLLKLLNPQGECMAA